MGGVVIASDGKTADQHPVCVFSTVGVSSTVGHIMSTMGDILSTVEDAQYRRGIYILILWGCLVPWGKS